MTTLIITDIKGSKWDINQDIITAVIANAESDDFYCLLVQVKNLFQGRIIESATASEDLPEIGINKGDFYIKMQSSINHGLKAGDKLDLDRQC